MMKVFLKDLQFNVPRGTFEEEHMIGTQLAIDIEIFFKEVSRVENENQTVNYVDLYEIVKRQITKNGGLLETVAMDICADIKREYPQVIEFNITISKLQPPILNFQ